MLLIRGKPARADLRKRIAPLAVGDLVRTGENSWPQYLVIAVSEDRAWVRDLPYGADFIVPVGRCIRISIAQRNRRS